MGTLLDSLQKPTEHKAPHCCHFIDGNKHCEHPSTQTLHWADSAHPSKPPPDRTSQIMPKASEQKCAMDSSDTWIRGQLRQIKTSQCCVCEIPQLPLSLCNSSGSWNPGSSRARCWACDSHSCLSTGWLTQEQPHSHTAELLGVHELHDWTLLRGPLYWNITTYTFMITYYLHVLVTSAHKK